MPCYDGRGAESDRRAHEKVDKLTRLLCEAMGYLDLRNLGDGSEELRDWWAEHKEWDRIRESKRRKGGK